MSAWIVAIALIAGANAPRLAPALPRGGRTRTERMIVAAGGAGLAAVCLLGLAVAGDPIASWWDVSAPTVAVAAGLVLVLATVATVARRPRTEPALPGRRAMFVPVAVPFVLRPELGLLCLAAGADGLLVAAAGGLVAIVASVTVAALTSDEGTSRRVVAWAAWGCQVATIAAGIAITVDGVLAV